MKKRCRVLVIGAGPAGCYAAWRARRENLDVLLVERDRQIGKPLCCAEGISHVGLTSFVKPQDEFISRAIDSLRLNVSSGKSVEYEPGDRMGYVLDRPAFENYMADKAIALGAELHLETYALDIVLAKDKPALVTLIQRGSRIEIEADFVIAADGVESLIGRKAGIDTGLKLKQCESAIQYRVSNIDVDDSALQFFVGSRYSPNGYLWVFPKSSHSANIGLGLNPGEVDAAELRGLLDTFLQENYPNAKIEFESCGMVPKFIGIDILGKENLVLAGDAARMIDSLSGAGIARALHTGKLAVESIVSAIQEEWTRGVFQSEYRKRVNTEIGSDMRVFQKVYPVVRKFTEKDWDSLVDFLNSYLKNQKAESIDPAALIKSALTTAPGLIRLARHIF